ncbi:probable glutathione S-transferase [Mercurialis annua]|uniref:probable glutathione S-transferase n=1 Tax=Mercurialis annua TaxID=3986 RepID=UPI00215E1C50|nr:probable glutathione S-transferase [Mercurialis annua]
MSQVKLHGAFYSPFSGRVQIALRLKGVEYEYVEEDLANKSDLLIELNPVHKKIPVLVHNGKPISESFVIVEYIDETWKENPILPQDPYERAMARFWAQFVDEKCNAAIWGIIWSRGEEREKAIEEACQHLKTLENELKDKKFFGGETIGLVDIAANFLGFWVGIVQEAIDVEFLTKEKFPILCNWTEEFCNCDVIKETLPPKDKLFGMFQSRFNAPSWKY